MAKSTPTHQTILDPMFPIPEGAEESFVHSDEVVVTGVVEVDESEVEGFDPDAIDDSEEYYDVPDGGEDYIETPTVFAVVEQTLRRAPGGQHVVDVVVDVEDIEGAINYEFHVVKI